MNLYLHKGYSGTKLFTIGVPVRNIKSVAWKTLNKNHPRLESELVWYRTPDTEYPLCEKKTWDFIVGTINLQGLDSYRQELSMLGTHVQGGDPTGQVQQVINANAISSDLNAVLSRLAAQADFVPKVDVELEKAKEKAKFLKESMDFLEDKFGNDRDFMTKMYEGEKKARLAVEDAERRMKKARLAVGLEK